MTNNAITSEVVRIMFAESTVRPDQRLKQNLVEGVVRTLTTEVASADRWSLVTEVASALEGYCIRKRGIEASGQGDLDDRQSTHHCTQIYVLGANVLMVYDHDCLPTVQHFNEFVLNLQRLGRNYRLSA